MGAWLGLFLRATPLGFRLDNLLRLPGLRDVRSTHVAPPWAGLEPSLRDWNKNRYEADPFVGRKLNTPHRRSLYPHAFFPKMRHEQSNDFVSFCSIILAAAPPRSSTPQIFLSALAYRRLDALGRMVVAVCGRCSGWPALNRLLYEVVLMIVRNTPLAFVYEQTRPSRMRPVPVLGPGTGDDQP